MILDLGVAGLSDVRAGVLAAAAAAVECGLRVAAGV